MILNIILQTSVNDITFRTMDVVVIVGGVISILTTFFILRFQSQTNKEKLEAYMVSNEKEIVRLEKDIEKNDVSHSDFKKEIFKKMEDQSNEIHKLALGIGDFKTEILQKLSK